MAQFTLNIRDGDALIRDPQVYDFPTAQAARDAALRTVAELIAARPRSHGFQRKQIEIADATGHAVTVVSISDVAPVVAH